MKRRKGNAGEERPARRPVPRKLNGRARRGASTVEFAFVGIPIIFILVSIFEISRGMWVYETGAFAVKEGVRFAVVHGVDCVNTTSSGGSNPNSCVKGIADVAAVIQNAAVGLTPGTTQLTFTPGSAGSTPTSCYLASPGSPVCSTLTTQWPPDTFNGVSQSIRIDITTPFTSALAMFWPGSKGVNFASVNFGASSLDYIQF